jgi:hypothetical protein
VKAGADQDLSIGERAEYAPAKPIAWVVVVLICSGFIVGGIALVIALPWLFFSALGLLVFTIAVGWATHAMAGTSTRA